LTRERLEQYGNAFQRRGVPGILSIFAVIDTKKQKICQPGQNQLSLYSGHKRIHCSKYQTLEGPDGLTLHCTPCYDGPQSDGYILQISGLYNFLRQQALFISFVILGDSTYPNNDVMVSIFKGGNLSTASEAFNRVMCPLRTCVEWGYSNIVRYWAFFDFHKQMKIQLVRVEAM
jgi:hypothetical protein